MVVLDEDEFVDSDDAELDEDNLSASQTGLSSSSSAASSKSISTLLKKNTNLKDTTYGDDDDHLASGAGHPIVDDEDESDSQDDDTRGLVGLQNLGNTCYMNGALQALSNCQQLTRFFLDCPMFVKNSGISHSYSELIKQIWLAKNSRCAIPSGIIRNIKYIYPTFRGCSQQDTQEFLRFFLEQLHDELKEPVIDANDVDKNSGKSSASKCETTTTAKVETTTSSSSGPHNEDSGDIRKLTSSNSSISEDTSTSNTTTTNIDNSCNSKRSIISDIFEFRISSSVVCSSCNNISTTKETFKDLSIPIPSRDHPYYQSSSIANQSSSECYASTLNNKPSLTQSTPTLSNGLTESCVTSRGESLETTTSDESKDESTDEQQQLAQLAKLSFVDSIPMARRLITWLGRLGNWFWGPQVSLQDCFSIFFGTDPLEGDNEYSCEVCTKKNKGVKYLKILDLPEVLCIHFKRYGSIGAAKITTHVSFPLTGLDLAPFMSSNSENQCTTYNLIACICHHGSALLTGHYTTYALNCYDDQWYEFDDQYVTCVSSYQVENSEAYILFYQKAAPGESIEKQRVRASELLRKSSSIDDKTTKKYFISKSWVSKFNTFVEPGPISNHDFLCTHEKVAKSKQKIAAELCHSISEPVWNYLKELHGGGPECTELIPCEICE